mgnify:CR=1 FL=1
MATPQINMTLTESEFKLLTSVLYINEFDKDKNIADDACKLNEKLYKYSKRDGEEVNVGLYISEVPTLIFQFLRFNRYEFIDADKDGNIIPRRKAPTDNN